MAGIACIADCVRARPAAWHGGALCWTRRSRFARTTRRSLWHAPCCRCAHHHHAGMGPSWHGMPGLTVSLPSTVVTCAGLQARAFLVRAVRLPARCDILIAQFVRRAYARQHLGCCCQRFFLQHMALTNPVTTMVGHALVCKRLDLHRASCAGQCRGRPSRTRRRSCSACYTSCATRRSTRRPPGATCSARPRC